MDWSESAEKFGVTQATADDAFNQMVAVARAGAQVETPPWVVCGASERTGVVCKFPEDHDSFGLNWHEDWHGDVLWAEWGV